jgi:uncharacterized membrane protein
MSAPRRRSRLLGSVAIAGAIVLVSLPCLAYAVPLVLAMERVSVDPSGVQGNGASNSCAISADGRYVAFYSAASNLVTGDTNGQSDVFVRDRQTGATTRVSVDSAGTQGNGGSERPAISSDGRYVAFYSSASNLVTGDTNGKWDVFIHDRQDGTTTRVSVDTAGAEGNGDSWSSVISSDGRYVAFYSVASNLVTGDTNGQPDVFVRDRQSGTTTRVSVDSAGTQGNYGSSGCAISADGRYVAFFSTANNLVAGDTNNANDVFVHDRQDGTTTRVSVDSSGVQGNGSSESPAISADGRFVTFYSDASNLVTGDTNGTWDVFLRDRQSGTTTRVSVDSAGTQSNGMSFSRGISADGRYVTFYSIASNLVTGDTNGKWDVFMRDAQSGTTTRVSVGSAGTQGSGDSKVPAISADGRYVAFESVASNLVTGDTNGQSDVFVATIGEPTPIPVHRFYNFRNGSHFYTISPAERDWVAGTLGAYYRYEGVGFLGYGSGGGALNPVYRFYNFRNGSHFYTISQAERDWVNATLDAHYRYEGVAFWVASGPADGDPVHRFYNRLNNSHFYTVNAAEHDRVNATLGAVYRDEGTAFYAPR